jgi:hypothetical protein
VEDEFSEVHVAGLERLPKDNPAVALFLEMVEDVEKADRLGGTA